MSWGKGRYDVFLTDDFGGLHHYWYPHHEPSGPTWGLEFVFKLPSAAREIEATTRQGRLDVVTVDGRGDTFHFYQNDGSPFGFEKMTQWLGPQHHIGIVSPWPNRLDILGYGRDLSGPPGPVAAYINHAWQNPYVGGWSTERVAEIRSGTRISDPSPLAVINPGSSHRLDFFTMHMPGPGPYNIDSSLYYYWKYLYSSGDQWRVEPMGGSWFSRSYAAASYDAPRLDVFAIGDNRQLYHYWRG